MKKLVKNQGNKMMFGMMLAVAVMASSCKKEAAITPDNGRMISMAATPSATAGLKISQPIVLNGVHDMVVDGYAITGGSVPCIDLTNCYNIRITNCRLDNSDNYGIHMSDCQGITVESCRISDVLVGVYAFNSGGVHVENNTIIEVKAQSPVYVAFEAGNIDKHDFTSNRSVNNIMQ